MSNVQPAFLLSLPRSGSTLAQRMLGAHSAIATVAEPWLLLPLFYAMRPDGVYAEYSQKTSAMALQGFWQALPGGRQDYLAEVGAMTLRLYEKASDGAACYFLDKTPRYSLVIDELFETFPDAKFVFLWRNPLAVVASIVDTWFGGRWTPYHHKVDLFVGLENLVAASQRHQEIVTVRYEDLVTDPRAALERILCYLELPWEEAVVRDLEAARVDGPVGDDTGLRRYRTISRESIDRWHTTLSSPVRKAWCRRYLDWIGDERLSVMGYDRQALRHELDAIPSRQSHVVRDLGCSAKGLVSLAVEPRILRHKLDRLPEWRKVFMHT
ncbi:MAG: sulfotransferase family protein [Egibacteraceae bacterium]